MSTYYAPTKLYIGKEEQNVGPVIAGYGFKKVLFVYGGGSIKRSGLYDTIKKSLLGANLKIVEAGGVEPNPKIGFVRSVIASKPDIDFILAVGGGSVIDTAKSISVGLAGGIDPWEYSMGRAKPTKALPIGVVLTIAAAGSEMSDSCVISDPDSLEKRGFNSDLFRPLFSIMNPELTFSVSRYQTACGVVDIMMHTLERYITDRPGSLANEFAIGLLKTVMESGVTAAEEPEDYEARKQLMLASSFSHNGLTNIGRGMCFRVHQFEHAISGVFDRVSHGAGLAVCWPAYSLFIYKNPKVLPKFVRLSRDLFYIPDSGDSEKDALEGINKMKKFFSALDMPTTLGELGIDASSIPQLAWMCSRGKTRVINDVVPIGYDEMEQIFNLMV
ncbi:MAG: iron-containing alcohol dehydrogenase [Clostridia bacterium]|nr:iron-containing alcohol dehydrogenase [Clostridia bacterium]